MRRAFLAIALLQACILATATISREEPRSLLGRSRTREEQAIEQLHRKQDPSNGNAGASQQRQAGTYPSASSSRMRLAANQEPAAVNSLTGAAASAAGVVDTPASPVSIWGTNLTIAADDLTGTTANPTVAADDLTAAANQLTVVADNLTAVADNLTVVADHSSVAADLGVQQPAAIPDVQTIPEPLPSAETEDKHLMLDDAEANAGTDNEQEDVFAAGGDLELLKAKKRNPGVAEECEKKLNAWAQCGGKTNCQGGSCGMQAWPGTCCVASKCVCSNEWYCQCQPEGNNGGNNNGNNGGNNNNNGNNGGSQQPNDPSKYKPEPPVPAKKVNGEYDYGQVLGLSFLFYEAQRSGKRPANNRIDWRGDSGLHHTYKGRDVTGGWYDAGDNVKFNLPMAWSAGVLAWSIVEFKKGYVEAGQYQIALDNLKWVTDYFIKAVGDGTEIVAQVGNGAQDHSVWGRPEDVTGPVPIYTLTKDRPGSDVVGAMGAALGAASVAFKGVDNAYSAKLLDAATKAYNFATKYVGKYSDSVPDASSFYRSSNMYDDIAFNALWLFQATGNQAYKQAGYDYYMKHYKEEDGGGVWDNYDWDSNSWGDVVLLSRYYPNDALIKSRIDGFIKSWTKGSNWVQFTPKGLAYSGPWGSLRHVGNALFLIKAYVNGAKNLPAATKNDIDCITKQQLGYILGDTGRSFVVGYGTNPPQRPHHRASSCPPLGVPCTWDYFNNPGPNPHTLYGALVGGPGSADDYVDARNDYIKNEVATDYNAGFTGALAAAEQGLQCRAQSEVQDDADSAVPDHQGDDSSEPAQQGNDSSLPAQPDDDSSLPAQPEDDSSLPAQQPVIPGDTAAPADSADSCKVTLKAWDQCGGKSGCAGGKCGDGSKPWTGYCCPMGYTCKRNDDWYHNCQQDMNNNNGGGGGGGGGTGPIKYTPDPPVPAKKVNGEYDYGQVLGLSFLFYEAQRSGKRPANNRIDWRGDSGLHHTYKGRDVTGGWYDAGDNVKFNLPMAWSAGVLAWSIVEFSKGYKLAGEYEIALDNLKWVTDYFIKAVGDGTEIVAQVGNGAQDHSVWGRPEDVTGPVPVYALTKDRPGSDVVGAMGAALAAASVAFKGVDNAYSARLLDAATKAYNFATKYVGKYSDSVPDASSFYRSSNMYDDIAFNALWLFQATGNQAYKQAGYDYYMKHYKEEDGGGVWDNYDWDSNSWGDVVLLTRFYPNDALIKSRIDGFIKSWTKGSNWVQFTPKGLAYSGPWGSLRHVGNALFLMKAYVNGAKNLPAAIKNDIDCITKQQLGYILGDTGRSFVVGYGTNPPQRPHHRSSSCPPLGQACGWDYFNNPGPNLQTLYGALVGGPGPADDYTDARNDYIKNEVATDYNAGFTGALAAAEQGLQCRARSSVSDEPLNAAEPLSASNPAAAEGAAPAAEAETPADAPQQAVDSPNAAAAPAADTSAEQLVQLVGEPATAGMLTPETEETAAAEPVATEVQTPEINAPTGVQEQSSDTAATEPNSSTPSAAASEPAAADAAPKQQGQSAGSAISAKIQQTAELLKNNRKNPPDSNASNPSSSRSDSRETPRVAAPGTAATLQKDDNRQANDNQISRPKTVTDFVSRPVVRMDTASSVSDTVASGATGAGSTSAGKHRQGASAPAPRKLMA